MSIWSDETGFDVFTSDEFAEVEDDLGIEPAQQGASDWTPEDGYPDGTGSVRIWVDDESRRLTKVVVSNRWRERSKTDSLSQRFGEAFLIAQGRLGAVPELPSRPDLVGVPTLSWESLAELQQQSIEIEEESARLDARPADQVRPSRWRGTAVEGVSQNHMVLVRLNVFGLTQEVAFDEGWLAQSRVSQVCESVMWAHQEAYARFEPPIFEPGDRELLAQRTRQVNGMLMAMVKQGW